MKYNAIESVFRPNGNICTEPCCRPLEDGAVEICWQENGETKSVVRDAKGKYSEIMSGSGFVPGHFKLSDGTEIWGSVVNGTVNVHTTKNTVATIVMNEKYKNPEHATDGFSSPVFFSEGGEHVHVLMTSTAGLLFRADSHDYGKTWNEAFPINVACTNTKISGFSTPDLKVYLLMTPSASKKTPLFLMESGTFGSTFKKLTAIATGWGEFTDPYIMNADGKLYLTYIKNATDVMFAQIDL